MQLANQRRTVARALGQMGYQASATSRRELQNDWLIPELNVSYTDR